MQTWQIQTAKARFSELVKQAAEDGPQEITQHGKPVAVVVSVADAAWLEAMENKIDIELAREAKADMERLGGKTYSHEEVFAELDEDDPEPQA